MQVGAGTEQRISSNERPTSLSGGNLRCELADCRSLHARDTRDCFSERTSTEYQRRSSTRGPGFFVRRLRSTARGLCGLAAYERRCKRDVNAPRIAHRELRTGMGIAFTLFFVLPLPMARREESITTIPWRLGALPFCIDSSMTNWRRWGAHSLAIKQTSEAWTLGPGDHGVGGTHVQPCEAKLF